MGGSDISVTPSALGMAGDFVRNGAGRVREAAAVLAVPAGSIVGDKWSCGESLTRVERLVGQAVEASAAGVAELARALELAAVTYSRVDSTAVPSSPRR